MLELEDARGRIVSSIPSCPAETIPLNQALGRFLAQPVLAPVSLPPFDNSAMDGYAVRSVELKGASSDHPVALSCAGAIPAGPFASAAPFAPRTCLRIFTGAPLPAGADAVVMQEDTIRTGDMVQVLDAVKPWENVRLTGEDLKQGMQAADGGQRISAGRIALLGALGIREISVRSRPLVGVLSTGNELIEGGTLRPGEIFESNRNAISSLLTQAGANIRVYPLVGDSMLETRTALESALAECDCVVTTGGVSVGERDVVKEAFESLSGTLEFWRVAIKPGKPFVFGRWRQKFLFGLPGNPVSAFVTCLLLVYPAVLKFQGARQLSPPEHPAILAEDMVNRGDRCHFMRVLVDAQGSVRGTGLQASHALSSLANANALLPVPPNTTWSIGRQVAVLRWDF